MSDLSSAVARPGRLRSWRHALSTVNPPAGAAAGLLAVRERSFAGGWFALAFVGILLAHVSNNLLNDLFDTKAGLDTGEYPRALYAPHPILSGMISRPGLVRAAVAVNAAGSRSSPI